MFLFFSRAFGQLKEWNLLVFRFRVKGLRIVLQYTAFKFFGFLQFSSNLNV